MEKPAVATRAYPRSLARPTAAARSSTSRSPTVERPPERPWPRKEKVTTAACRARTATARRSAGRSTDPVKPCATTIAVSVGPAAQGSWRASRRTPSSVRKDIRKVSPRGPYVSEETSTL